MMSEEGEMRAALVGFWLTLIFINPFYARRAEK